MEAAHTNYDQFLKNPGVPVTLDSDVYDELKEAFFPNKHDKDAYNTPHFFGAQVVSMQKQHLNTIFNVADKKPMDYLLCEKSDGFRYLLIVTSTGDAIVMGRDSSCFKVDIRIGANFSVIPAAGVFKNVVEILDGELVIDQGGHNSTQSGNKGKIRLRFLVFDALVHMRKNICTEKYELRLMQAQRFLKNNQFALQWMGDMEEQSRGQEIEIMMKDFLPLHDPNSTKENFLEFFFDSYLPCLNHENDGVIFNDRHAPYAIGRKTEAYIKWKPPHLNTVDFMVRHNEAFFQRHEDSPIQVLDLYANGHDKESGQYRPLFFTFTVVTLQTYLTIKQAFLKRNSEVEGFVEGVVAECRLVKTPEEFKSAFRELLAEGRDNLALEEYITNSTSSAQQDQMVAAFKSGTHMTCWDIYKLRIDKANANDWGVAHSIVSSIKDGITKQVLVRRWNEYFAEARKSRRN